MNISVFAKTAAPISTIDSDVVVNSFQQEFTSEQHLTFDQLVGYLEKKPETDRVTVETHLEICSSCKGEYEDLKSFYPGGQSCNQAQLSIAFFLLSRQF